MRERCLGLGFVHLSLFGFFQAMPTSAGSDKRFVVKIEVRDGNLNCAGTIIAEDIVLTSAHCVHNQTTRGVSVVQYAPFAANRYEVNAIVVHPDFRILTLCNDVALLRTKKGFAEPWKAVIVKDTAVRKGARAHENCDMIGWMTDASFSLLDGDSKRLRPSNRLDLSQDVYPYRQDGIRLTRVPVSLISLGECARTIKNFGGSFQGDKKLCGFNMDEQWCSIGSGGPLMCSRKERPSHPGRLGPRWRTREETYSNLDYDKVKYLGVNDTLGEPVDLLASLREGNRTRRKVTEEYQTGVVSWGRSCSKLPSVFVRTDTYYDWIKSTVKSISNKSGSVRAYSAVFETVSKSGEMCQTFPRVFISACMLAAVVAL